MIAVFVRTSDKTTSYSCLLTSYLTTLTILGFQRVEDQPLCCLLLSLLTVTEACEFGVLPR